MLLRSETWRYTTSTVVNRYQLRTFGARNSFSGVQGHRLGGKPSVGRRAGGIFLIVDPDAYWEAAMNWGFDRFAGSVV